MEDNRVRARAANDISGSLDDSAVAAYLYGNPDFLIRNPDLIEVLTPPNRSEEGAVVDLQKFMVERLRGEVDSLRECAQSLIDTSRDNLAHQSRTHSAVIAVIGAGSIVKAARVLRDDVAAILNLDAVTMCFEAVHPAVPDLADDAIRTLPAGGVDRLLGENREVRLIAETADDGTVFGAAAGRVRSCALVRLHMRDAAGGAFPPAVLAFGARDGGTFQPGQGTDLITFLARAIEKCATQWTSRI